MSAAVHNVGLRSNVDPKTIKVLPQDPNGHSFDVQFPLKVLKPVDHGNNPLFAVNEYTVNKKTVVQDIFNKRNLNEHLNFKNTFYLNERGETANNEINTIYDHGKVYIKNTVEAGLKAQYAEKIWKEKHIENEKKVKQSFQKTTHTVAKIREEEARIEQEELAKHRKEVKKHFKKVQNVVGVMVGTISPKETSKKFKAPTEESEGGEINIHHIQKDVNDEEGTLNNRANIRQLMGSRSAENQEKVRAEKEEQERLFAMEEAQKASIERQEENRISKYLDMKKLQKTWKIDDKEKLRETVRNEIMKDILKEEERRNFDKMATNTKMMQSIENEKKSIVKPVKKARLEPPKPSSPQLKKSKKSKKKTYTFSPQKIEKFSKETKEDFNTRFNFNVLALPSQKAMLDPVEQHRITRDFQEMVVKNGLKQNGNLVFEL